MANIKNKFRSIFSTANKHWLVVFLLIMLLAVLARFSGLTKASIWHDEGFSVMLSSRDWLEIWAGSARDVHPPLYYELLHGWSLIFGSSPFVLRALSAVCGVIVVGLGYLVTLRISKRHNIAALAGLLLALNPFLVRYSQEARMYGVLGVFVLIAMLGLIRIVINSKDRLGYLLYILGISAGLYTHYFMALVVISFWIYVISIYFVATKSKPGRVKLLTNWRWWLANIVALALFMPWAGNMIKQFTRAQGLGWLPKANLGTYHDTIWQFFTFTDAHKIWEVVYWAVPVVLIVATIYATHQDKTKQHLVRMLGLFCFVPIALAISVSLIKPIFHERYFVFVVLGLCIILAFCISDIYKKHRYIAVLAATVLIFSQLVGLRNVNSQAGHRMDSVMGRLTQGFMPGDQVVAGELYVYFDGSFYNSTQSPLFLYTGNGRPNGFGESGLIYDKNIYIDSYSQISRGRVWLLGKTGSHSYYDQIPSNWVLVESYTAGYSEIRLYQIQ